MSADKEFRQRIFTRVFALLGSRFIADFSFGTAPCKLLLNTIKRVPVDDRRMMICHQIHRAFTVVFHNLLVMQSDVNVFCKSASPTYFSFFQNALNQRLIPDFPAHCGWQFLVFKGLLNACETVSVEE